MKKILVVIITGVSVVLGVFGIKKITDQKKGCR